MSDMYFMTELNASGELCMTGRAVAGYARYVKLVDTFITTKKFTSSARVGP
jgi:hypothetical protein